jgi:hypothetical protein
METNMNYVNVRMSLYTAINCSHSGPCDSDVKNAISRKKVAISRPRYFVGKITLKDAIRKELKECGAWDDEELKDDNANVNRITWIAAGNITEKWGEKCSH